METSVYKLSCGCIVRVENEPTINDRYHWWDLSSCSKHRYWTREDNMYVNNPPKQGRLNKTEASIAILRAR